MVLLLLEDAAVPLEGLRWDSCLAGQVANGKVKGNRMGSGPRVQSKRKTKRCWKRRRRILLMMGI
jgi:hypothetical protein